MLLATWQTVPERTPRRFVRAVEYARTISKSESELHMNRCTQLVVLFACNLLVLSACGGPPVGAPPAALPVGTTWQWVGLTEAQPAGQSAVADPQNYLLLLNADSTYAFKADCNMGIGQYTATASSLTIKPAPVALSDCGAQSSYAKYLQLLGNVGRFETANDQLILILNNDAGRMTFARSAATLGAGGTQQMQIVGVPWQWTDLTGARPGGQQLLPEPGKYTLTLNQDGTYQAKADCNTVSGTFTIEGNKINLVPGPTTAAECGPNSLSQQYLTLLGNVETFSANAGRLTLTLKEDMGNMVFARG